MVDPTVPAPRLPTHNLNPGRVRLKQLARVAAVATGVQFGWALQLSLLTPYVQDLGIPHQWAGWIWLCGPISGMVVQPLVGHLSDTCTSRWGRRRPFIAAGALFACLSFLLIAFSADIGALLGDTTIVAAAGGGIRLRAVVVFVVGFWMLDLANNTLQGPCRALLADFTGKESKRTRRANSYFSAFMALGNVLGFGAGSFSGLRSYVPLCQVTSVCGPACSNLKAAFLIAVVLLVVCTALSVTAAAEEPIDASEEQIGLFDEIASAESEWAGTENRLNDNLLRVCSFNKSSFIGRTSADLEQPLMIDSQSFEKKSSEGVPGIYFRGDVGQYQSKVVSNVRVDEDEEELDDDEQKWFIWELLTALRDLPEAMRYVMIVTAFTWLSWFPFLLFDTDWMGREIYGGSADGLTGPVARYHEGVRAGSLGLLLNSVASGVSALLIEPLSRRIGSRCLWAISNAVLATCLFLTRAFGEPTDGLASSPSQISFACAMALFAALGFPYAVTCSVPYSMTASLAARSGGGQGLSMGILNLAIVFPQILVSVGTGPIDEMFGGGNLPAFTFAAAFACIGSVLAFTTLPIAPADSSDAMQGHQAQGNGESRS